MHLVGRHVAVRLNKCMHLDHFSLQLPAQVQPTVLQTHVNSSSTCCGDTSVKDVHIERRLWTVQRC